MRQLAFLSFKNFDSERERKRGGCNAVVVTAVRKLQMIEKISKLIEALRTVTFKVHQKGNSGHLVKNFPLFLYCPFDLT